MEQNLLYLNKTTSNIKLNKNFINQYSATDGLSLQNLFYAQNGYFPGSIVFEPNGRENLRSEFDTDNLAKYLLQNPPQDEYVEFLPHTTFILQDGIEKENLGFCIIWHRHNIYARFEKRASESYILHDNEHVEFAREFAKNALKFYGLPDKKPNSYLKIIKQQFGYNVKEAFINPIENFDVNKFYNDDFQKEDKKIREFIEAPNKSGLVILHGEPGTGKSTYLKNLVKSYPKKNFVFIPSNLISRLNEPEFVTFMESLENHIFIMEDCEKVLKDRKIDKSSSNAVSVILNMTDGFLSDDLSIKLICTFNDDTKNIDEALMRKGRIVSKYEFKPLCLDKTNALCEELGIEKSKEPLTLADIFHYNNDSYKQKRKSII